MQRIQTLVEDAGSDNQLLLCWGMAPWGSGAQKLLTDTKDKCVAFEEEESFLEIIFMNMYKIYIGWREGASPISCTHTQQIITAKTCKGSPSHSAWSFYPLSFFLKVLSTLFLFFLTVLSTPFYAHQFILCIKAHMRGLLSHENS